MSSEIEVPETPNWLQELEDKREKRLKARLGHETGAGAPCLKCGDKCPGLDLHFWRKCCKICKCAKEEHEVQDDDIYGWAQFQLLGSKPNKIKRKIILPGKKDEVELDWAPKGHIETVDKYLKTLPPEQLPVKGSQAAQNRKQLLQKQIPVHDIDPTLCHDLTEQELKQMNDYIAQVKQTSVGVGQIVSLSSIIKGNLHTLNPSEAAIIASRYAKGIPLSEIVKLQAQNRASILKQQNLNHNLDKLNLNDHINQGLPNYSPSSVSTTEQNLHPLISNKIHDINYPGYTKDINQPLLNPQYSSGLKSGQYKGRTNQTSQNQSTFDPIINGKFLQNSNFDPKNIPSQFINQGVPWSSGKDGQQNVPYNENARGSIIGDGSNHVNSAFVPYSKFSTGFRPGENYVEENSPTPVNYSSNLPGRDKNTLEGFRPVNMTDTQNKPIGYGSEHNYAEDNNSQSPNYARNLTKGTPSENWNKDIFSQNNSPGNNSPFKNSSSGFIPAHSTGKNFGDEYNSGDNTGHYENIEDMKRRGEILPNYAPGKYSIYSEVQSPTRIPKNVKDLAFSTYDPSNLNPDDLKNNMADPKYPKLPIHVAGQPYQNNSSGIRPENVEAVGQNYHGNEFISNTPDDLQNVPFNTNFGALGKDQYGIPTGKYPTGNPSDKSLPNKQFEHQNMPYDPKSSQFGGPHNYPASASTLSQNDPVSGEVYNQITSRTNEFDRNAPAGQFEPPNLSYENYPSDMIGHSYPSGQFGQENVAYGNRPAKKLSEMLPGKINVNEDFLHPSQVTIGAIQDINYPEIKAATHGTNDFYEDYSPDSLREILNNIKLPDCHYCKKPFEENEFAITIDRANVLFHAECFKCAGCNQILADNVYFYNKETDNIYCGRDYAKIRGFPRCKACDELIFTKEYCLADHSTFHLKHFCCIECDTPLAGQDYTLEEDMPYCLPCFEQSKANKCSACCRVIKPDEIGCNLNGVHFHAVDECFACKICKMPLMGKKLLLRNQKLYCSHDCFGADK